MIRRWVWVSTFTTLFASPVVAVAQTPKDAANADHYSYEFDLDFLDGGTLAGDGPILRVRPGAARAQLLRLRSSFVPELKKSVEAW